MTIEQKVFSRKRFITKRLADYGFINNDACYSLSKGFLDGDFTAEIRVYENGTVNGRVMDNMIGEEYTPLRMPNYAGAFVGSVREAYEELLRDIAFPWEDEKHGASGVFRHGSNNKWFGLIMNIDRRLLDKGADEEAIDVLNLKADENKTGALHKIRGIYPAYHMNHKKWISVTLDDTLEDRDVMDLIDESFRLTSGAARPMNEKLMREVYAIADSIPPGKVMSYGQIAAVLGRPKNSRLIGKIMSLADRYGDHPCHRVVNSAGRTVPGWPEQRELLEAEGVTFRKNGNVDMAKHRVE